MANYIDSTVFINGSKRAIVNFINKGLKNNKLSLRVSTRMPGEQIASLLADLDREHCLATFSFLPHPKTFDHWDTTNKMISFREWYINGCTADHRSLEDSKAYHDTRVARNKEIYDFMLTHPNDFQPIIPKEIDPDFVEFNREMGIDLARATSTPNFASEDYDRAVGLMHPELVSSYRKYVRGYRRAVAYQKKKYGLVGWYDWAAKHHGCKWAAFEKWKCLKDADGILCLTAEVDSPWCPPITFFEYMNNLDGITVYAYGREACYWGYMWNGRTLEGAEINPDKDSRYEQMLQEYADEKGVDLNSYEAQHGCIPGFYYEDIYARILNEYLDKYKVEINSELGLDEQTANT